MSRAFVKEADDDREALPELQLSPHRNFVTPEGLRQIEAEVQRLRDSLAAARASEDRTAVARLQRDLRYWVERLRTAEVVQPPPPNGVVRFGSVAVLETAAGRRIEYRIVGEDEADPAAGRISYVAPLARKLIGSPVGTEVEVAGEPAELVAIR